MTVCAGPRSDRHPEIVHEEGNDCPLCDALSQLKDKEADYQKARAELIEARRELEEATK